MATQTVFIDSRDLKIKTTDPRVDGDGSALAIVSVPEGMSALECLSTLQGWIQSFRGVPDAQRTTVVRVNFG